MKERLERVLALALASAVSLGVLSSVAALADDDRAAVSVARQARAVMIAERAVAVRR